MATDVVPVEILEEVQRSVTPFTRTNAAPAYRQLQALADKLLLPLMCVDVRTGRILGETDPSQLNIIPPEVTVQLAPTSDVRLYRMSSGLIYFSLPLPPLNEAPVVAVGSVLSQPGQRPDDLVIAAAAAGWSQAEFDEWLSDFPYFQAGMLQSYLSMAIRQTDTTNPRGAEANELDEMLAQLEYTYEEISLLHSLTQNMQISRAPGELAGLSLERLMGVIHAEGHLIWLDDREEQPVFLVEGKAPFDEMGMARLIARFEDFDWSRPLVKNKIAGSLLGAEFPGLKNLVLVPISEGNRRFGWLCSCNMENDQEFGTVQASLLASVASILGTHGRNLDLYRQHEELLLCFVKSLVSSLDAKDPYTRGHSERVALIGRRLGAELQLPEEDLRDIYLSGLLHDIGKIGVDDQILRKPGHLTQEEFEQVKKHPVIGYNILAGLKNLRTVIPGVRYHHESWSGNGYPDRLAGDEIPLMARILAVADSYDAMGSDRPYRKGMPTEALERILRDGSAKQWDPQVIDAYFRAREDIKWICDSYSYSSTEPAPGQPEAGTSGPRIAGPMITTEGIRAALTALDSSRPSGSEKGPLAAT